MYSIVITKTLRLQFVILVLARALEYKQKQKTTNKTSRTFLKNISLITINVNDILGKILDTILNSALYI